MLRLQPENTYALANIGMVYTEQERWSEAAEMFSRVVRVEPDNLEAHYGLGVVHARQGYFPAALAAWQCVLRLQPDNEDARRNLALVQERMAIAVDAEAPTIQAAATSGPSAVPPNEPAQRTPAASPSAGRNGSASNGALARVAAAGSDLTETGSQAVAPASDRSETTEREPEIPYSDTARPRLSTLRRAGFIAAALTAIAAVGLTATYWGRGPTTDRRTGESSARSAGAPPVPGTNVSLSAPSKLASPNPESQGSAAGGHPAGGTTSSPSSALSNSVRMHLRSRTPGFSGRRLRSHLEIENPVRSSHRFRRSTDRADMESPDRTPKRHSVSPSAPHAGAGYNHNIDKLLDQIH